MRVAVYEKLTEKIQSKDRGTVFVTRDFLSYGSRAAVDEALSRLASNGILRRLGRGIYDYPKKHAVLGLVPTEPDKIAEALARKSSSKILRSGAHAANALGLSTQVPARPIYLTDGRNRIVKVGGQTIEFRHTAPSSMSGAGTIGRTVIQALKHVGQANIGPEKINHIRTLLSQEDREQVGNMAGSAPAWMTPFLKAIAE